jgi:hypothetical protein
MCRRVGQDEQQVNQMKEKHMLVHNHNSEFLSLPAKQFCVTEMLLIER